MKRFVCFLLTLVMIVSIVPATVLTASAASSLETSDKAIEILKLFEGFQSKPYKDGDKYYIGYGTYIEDPDKYVEGITVTEATKLLKDHIHPDDKAANITVDEAINNLAKRYNLAFTQYQHDALALFSYNCGTGWMSGGAFLDAVVNGKRGNEFLYAIGLWNGGNSDSDYFRGLMNRRMAEANMYLNNSYSSNAPANYTYVVLDYDGGTFTDEYGNTPCAFAYDSSSAPWLLAKPTNGRNTFVGWYMIVNREPVPVTILDASTSKQTLYAYWQGTDPVDVNYEMNSSECASRIVYRNHSTSSTVLGSLKENSKLTVSQEFVDGNGVKWLYGKGTDTKGNAITGWVALMNMNDEPLEEDAILATGTVTIAELNVRDAATTAGAKLGVLKKGDVVKILAFKNEYTAAGTASWGKIMYGGSTAWINLAYVDLQQVSGADNSTLVGKTATVVNAASVNIRANAGTEYADIGDIARGTSVLILETKKHEATGNLWAKIRWDGVKEGWIFTYYLKVAGSGSGNLDSAPTQPVLYTGIVTSNTNLNVRSTPKVSHDNRVGSLPKGTKINIYEKTVTNNVEWGRTNQGWVCLQYVDLTPVANSGNSGSDSDVGNHVVVKKVGTITAATLSLRKAATNNSDILATLTKGARVTILEQVSESTTTGSKLWGKVVINGVEGYINLAYVDIEEVTENHPDYEFGSTGNTGSGSTNTTGKAAVVSGTAKVNVRAEASASSALVKTLTNGTKVTVYRQIENNNAPWCETNYGWICGYYLTMTGETSNGGNNTTNPDGTINGTTPGVISATGIVNSATDLNVRAGAGLGFAKVGALKKGTQVTIYEQKFADNMTWGKTNSGWVCMSYITINSTSESGKGVMGTIARCFNAVNVRSAPGTGNALVGTILVGTRVEIFEQKLHGDQYWGRVAQGWISMQYVALDSEMPPMATEPDETEPTKPSTRPNTGTGTNTGVINNNPSVSFSFTGRVNASPDGVNVRKDATSLSDKAGTIAHGQTVNITALKSNTNEDGIYELWGRTEEYGTPGWINLAYVNYTIGTAVSPMYTQYKNITVYNVPSASGEDIGLMDINAPVVFTQLALEGTTVFGKFDMDDYVDYLTGPVGGLVGWMQVNKTAPQMVNVAPTHKMSEAGGQFNGKTYGDVTAYTSVTGEVEVFKFYPGSPVSVHVIEANHGIVWGKVYAENYKGEIVEGWIDITKVMFQTVGTVNAADGLNVRKVAGATTDDSIMGQLTNGTNVYITSLMMSADGELWGQIQTNDNLNGGWVNMKFVN